MVARSVRSLERVLADLERARTFGLAAELSFWVFLALIPLAAIGELVTVKIAAQHWLAIEPRITSLPPLAADFVSSELSSVGAWNGGSVALPATLVFLWLASSGAHAVFDVLGIQTRSRRPWWKKRLLALGVCVAFSVGAAVLALLGAWLDGIVGRIAVTALVDLAFVAVLFRIGVPREPSAPRLPVVPGAVLTTALQGALAWSYGVYIGAVGTGRAYEGALAVVGVTMTLIYLLSLALLFGAELNRRLAVTV